MTTEASVAVLATTFLATALLLPASVAAQHGGHGGHGGGHSSVGHRSVGHRSIGHNSIGHRSVGHIDGGHNSLGHSVSRGAYSIGHGLGHGVGYSSHFHPYYNFGYVYGSSTRSPEVEDEEDEDDALREMEIKKRGAIRRPVALTKEAPEALPPMDERKLETPKKDTAMSRKKDSSGDSKKEVKRTKK